MLLPIIYWLFTECLRIRLVFPHLCISQSWNASWVYKSHRKTMFLCLVKFSCTCSVHIANCFPKHCISKRWNACSEKSCQQCRQIFGYLLFQFLWQISGGTLSVYLCKSFQGELWVSTYAKNFRGNFECLLMQKFSGGTLSVY